MQRPFIIEMITCQQTDINAQIIEAVRKLTPVYRTVFNLFVIEGFSHEEISSQLNISVGASKSNLSKARHNLRKILTQQTEYRVYV